MAVSETRNSTDTFFRKTSTERTRVDDLTALSTGESVISLINVSGAARFLGEIDAALWKVAPPLLMILGTFGNVMTVVVMRRMRAHQSTACLSVYFTALAVSDQSVLLSCLLWFWAHQGFSWPPSFFRFDLLCSIPKFVWLTSAVTSAWFLVAMTYQRVTSVVAPHRVQVLCTVRRGKLVVAVIVVSSCALNVQYLFTWSYWPLEGQCQYRKKYAYFVDLLEWLDLVWGAIIPFLLLATGNCVLIWQVIRSMRLSEKLRGSSQSHHHHHQHQQQQATSATHKVHSMTMTLLLTSSAFLILTLPTCVADVCLQMYYTDHSDDEFRAMINLVRSVGDVLWLSSCALNFYLYILSGSKFRQETKRYLCCIDAEHAKWTVSYSADSKVA